jgi:iron complex outermembrane receptor protein
VAATPRRYGGEDAVDLGPANIGTIIQVPEPDFTYSARAIDRAELWSVGAAYRLDWRRPACSRWASRRKTTARRSISPGTPESEVAAQPFRAYANAAYAVTPQLTLYAGYTQGLENSGVAPNYAQNSGAVLPASLTWQVDSGARYAVTPKLKIIAGVFELQKPYFNVDTNNIDRELGVQQAEGHRALNCGRGDRGLPRQCRRSRRQSRHHRAGPGRRRRWVLSPSVNRV